MSGRWLWIVGGTFLVLKMGLALLGPEMVTTDNTADSMWYLGRAEGVAQTGSVLETDGTKTALFPVGYPYLLGMVGVVFGSTVRTAVVMNSLLSLVGAGLVYVAAKMLFGRKVGMAAGLVMLIAPAQYIYSQEAFAEHLFTVLLLLAVITTVLVVRRRLAVALLVGILIGLACLTRGQGLVLLVWFPAAGLILSGKWRTTAAATGLMLAGWLVVMSPWWVRNYEAFDRFVLISNNGGKNLCVGNIDTRYARPNFEYRINRELSGNEAQRDQIMKNAAAEYISQHPWRFIANAPLKIFWLYAADAAISFRQSVVASYGKIVGLMVLGYGQLLWMAVVIAALVGLAKTRFGREHKAYNLLYALLILWGLFHAIFFGGARFNFPMFGIVTVAAAGWICSLRQECKASTVAGDQFKR